MTPSTSMRCVKKNSTISGRVTSVVKATMAPMSGAPCVLTNWKAASYSVYFPESDR